jgi:hypothetical protein
LTWAPSPAIARLISASTAKLLEGYGVPRPVTLLLLNIRLAPPNWRSS